jgi:hypothetical protein
MANGISKNPSFHIELKNVNWILVKSAPKENFIQKTPKNWFLGKAFWGYTFFQGKLYFFEV